MLRALLRHSNGEELYMVDGSGDTPVHAVVQGQNLNYLKIMLQAHPSCIWRENAVGRTPAELAMSAWLQGRVTSVPDISASDNHHNGPWSLQPLTSRRPEGFVEKTEAVDGFDTRIWKLCKERMKAAPAKRKLISLNEANEVAKRLAATESSRKRRHRSQDGEEEEEEEEDAMDAVIRDEVSDWYGQSTDIW